jgi:hypothetical protein
LRVAAATYRVPGCSVHNAAFIKGCIVEGCSGHVQSSGLQRAQCSIKPKVALLRVAAATHRVQGCSVHNAA